MKEQILEKLKDEKFVEKLFVCESVEQVQDFFKDSGVEITKEEAQEVIDGMVMLSQKMLSLSEEELEACSGGSTLGDNLKKLSADGANHLINGIRNANDFLQENGEFVAGTAVGGAAGVATVAATIIAGVGAYKAGKYVYNAVKRNSKLISELTRAGVALSGAAAAGATLGGLAALMSFYED